MTVEVIAMCIISGLGIVAWGLGMRTLKTIDANQTNLFSKYDDHEHRLSRIEGKCDERHK